MKFCWTTITVNNLEESLSFYQDIVGLTVKRKFKAGPEVEIAFLGDGGDTEIELVHNAGKDKVNCGPDISLGFKVNSLEEKMAFVRKKGLTIHSGPFQPNPNVRFFFLLDPNGLKIQFVETLT